MSDKKRSRELPKKRRGKFLRFVDQTPFLQLILLGLVGYVAIVLIISLIEFGALCFFGFVLIEDSDGNSVGFFDTVYFNFVTILTVGYGDFSPVGFGRVLSTIEALLGVGLFAGAASLLTVKALRPSADTIVFSKYGYYCLDEQSFMVIFVNTSVSRLENCSISSYFKIGRDWSVSPACSPPFLTQAVQTFFLDRHTKEELVEKLTEGDCLRVCVAGTLMGSEVAASMQYKPEEIILLQNRQFIASYEPFWHPDFDDDEFIEMFHYKPEGANTLSEEMLLWRQS